jgi:hypothetical protein
MSDVQARLQALSEDYQKLQQGTIGDATVQRKYAKIIFFNKYRTPNTRYLQAEIGWAAPRK